MKSKASLSLDEGLFTAQSSGAWIFYLRGAGANAGIDRTIAFVPGVKAELPLTLSLAASWLIEGGVYFFLGEAAWNDRTLLENCRLWSAAQAPPETTFAWIANPNDDYRSWNAQVVRVRSRTATGGYLAATERIALRNYALVLAEGLGVALDSLRPGFHVGRGGKESGVRFEIRGGTRQFPSTGDGAMLALRGAGRGAWSCQLRLPAAKLGEPGALDELDAGIRYFYPTASDRIGSWRFPVFDARLRAILLDATLDPNDPLSVNSALTFVDEPEPLASYFRTTDGRVVGLRPIGCRLRFAVRAGSGSDPTRDEYYLVPSGPCQVSVIAGPVPARLMCGISAAEYIELDESGSGVVLSFLDGCPGFVPFLASRAVSPAHAPEFAPRLSDLALTSWVSIGKVGAQLGYFAQPEKALLYGPPPAPPPSTASTAPLLPFFPIRAALLAAFAPTTLESNAIAPMAPYAGCDLDISNDAMALEIEVLSQERRDRLVGTPAARSASSIRKRRPRRADVADTDIRVMTPGGFIATFAENHSDWRSLELARFGSRKLVLRDIEEPLRSALLANQQFVVISDPQSIGNSFAVDNGLEIDGWRFDISPERWSEHGTLMIIKSSDRAISDLAQDTATWTMPESFNAYPTLTQQELLAVIADARERVRSDVDAPGGSTADYTYFVHTVLDDPRWNGVLFLRAHVPVESLPDELDNLRPGIDPGLLFAHHLGVNQTNVRSEGATLVPGDSSLFGLIRYNDTMRPPGAPPANYAFQVLDLEVEFANSAMQNFSSRVVALVQNLFGAPATGRDPNYGSALVLTGAYQRRESKVVYVFHNENWNTFDLADAVLKSVTITRVEMASHSAAPANGNGASMRATRFNLWGSLAFRVLNSSLTPKTFDLFGFDSLDFSGLTLLMTYPADAPRAATFALDATGVTLDPSSARPRVQSLPRHFPITTRALTSSAATPDPGMLGFMPVQLPLIDTQRLGPDWFGVLLNLNLGTPGALSSLVDLSATLGLFWSPDTKNIRVQVGLKLPGSTGGRNELSLMGVLKLSIYSTQLLYAEGAFLLKLTGVTLRVMSKALPPAGDFEFFLFGDPDPRSGSSSLGWYAAYRNPKAPTERSVVRLDWRRFGSRHLLASTQPRAGEVASPRTDAAWSRAGPVVKRRKGTDRKRSK